MQIPSPFISSFRFQVGWPLHSHLHSHFSLSECQYPLLVSHKMEERIALLLPNRTESRRVSSYNTLNIDYCSFYTSIMLLSFASSINDSFSWSWSFSFFF